MEVGVSPSLQRGFGFLHPPIPPGHCIRLAVNLPSAKGSQRGLPRSERITGWVRCCLYTGRTASMCSHLTYLHLVFKPFGQCVSATFTFSRMTVRQRQFSYLHPATQADTLQNVAIFWGILSRQLHTPTLPLTHVPVGYS